VEKNVFDGRGDFGARGRTPVVGREKGAFLFVGELSFADLQVRERNRSL